MRSYLKLKNDYGKNLMVITIFLFAGYIIGTLLPPQKTIVIIPSVDTQQLDTYQLSSNQKTVLKYSPENLMYAGLNNNCHLPDLQNPTNFSYSHELPGDYMEGSQVYTETIHRDYQIPGGHPLLSTSLNPKLEDIEDQHKHPIPLKKRLTLTSHNILSDTQNNLSYYYPPSDCCVIEIRSYNLLPEKRDDFHKLIVQEVAPMLEKWNTDLASYGQSHHNRDFYYAIRAYKNLAEREQNQQEFYGSTEWRDGPRDSILSIIENYTTVVFNTNQNTIDAIRLNFNETNQ